MKASGNKLDYSIVPFAPLRQKEVSAITSGIVPDVMEDADLEFGALNPGRTTCSTSATSSTARRRNYSEIALRHANLYNNTTKKRAYYGVPMKPARRRSTSGAT